MILFFHMFLVPAKQRGLKNIKAKTNFSIYLEDPRLIAVTGVGVYLLHLPNFCYCYFALKIVGRFILGFAVALSAVGDCVYISEIAPPVI